MGKARRLSMGERARGALIPFVSLVAPRRAAMLSHIHQMRTDDEYRTTWLAMMRTLGYRSAEMGGNRTPWGVLQGSADEFCADIPVLRGRVRELERVDPLGSGVLDKFVKETVGREIVAQVRTDDTEKNTRMERFWNGRRDGLFPADAVTFGAAQRLQVRRWIADGDCFVNAVKEKPDTPIWFELIEADRVYTPFDKMQDKNVRDGVERDGFGRPVRIWVSKTYPTGIGQSSDMVGLYAKYCRHMKETERPGQTRGIPWLHAVMQDIRDLDLLIIASLKRIQIAACLAVFIKSDESPFDSGGVLADAIKTTARRERLILDDGIEPGMIMQLLSKESVETLVPSFPTPELTPFIVLLCQRIGAGLGVSWQEVLNTYYQSNYSSARTDKLDSWATFDLLRASFERTLLDWEWRLVFEDGLMRGEPLLRGVTMEDIERVEWIPPSRPWVDPRAEAAGAQAELLMGIVSPQMLAAGKARDWEAVARQRIEAEVFEKRLRKEAGLDDGMGSDGSDGSDGTDGTDGADGTDGTDGTDAGQS